jgi:hypothetical protein
LLSILSSGCTLYFEEEIGGGGGIDAGPGGEAAVQVTGYDLSGMPLAGHTVLWMDAADSVLAETSLDANGKSSWDVPMGGSAALLVDDDEIAMWRDLREGDSLVWGVAAQGLGSATTVQVTFPAHADATDYVARTSCDSATSTTPTVALDFCGDDRDIAVVARDATGQAVGTLYQVSVDTTGPATLSAGYTTSELIAIELGNAPTGLQVEFTTMISVGTVGVIDTQTRTYVAPEVVPGTLPALPMEVLVARTDEGVVQTVIAGTDGARAPQVDLGNYGPQARLFAIYWGGFNVPELGNLAFAPETGTVSWTAGPANRAAHGTVIRLEFDDVRWNVAIRGDRTWAVLPSLPAAYAVFAPSAGDAWTLELVEYCIDIPAWPIAHGNAFQAHLPPSPNDVNLDYTIASASSL